MTNKKLFIFILSILSLLCLAGCQSTGAGQENVSLQNGGFFDIYGGWILVTAGIVLLATIAYVIYIFVSESTLADVWDEIADHFYIAICFFVIAGGSSLFGFLTSNWINVLIVLGGLLCFIVLALLAHLVQHIIYTISENSDGFYTFIDETDDDCDESEDEEEDEEDENDKSSTSVPPKSNISFDDIAGLDEAKKAFRERVILPLKHKELFEMYSKKAGGGILLYGLPGTGKTMFAEAASNELDALFINVKCSDIKSKWYGNSEKSIKKIFDKARKAKTAIIFFDEFEAIGSKRTDDAGNGNNDLVPQILAEMQGVGSQSSEASIMVIAATNKPWAIDSAFLRPGRFDEKIYIPLPDLASRRKLFELKLHGIPTDGLDYDYLAEKTEGFNGADINEFCEKLKLDAITATISSGEKTPISMEMVYKVEKYVKSSVSKEDVAALIDFEKR